MAPSLTCWAALALIASLASASPLQSSVLERRQSVTTLTSAQVSAFKPYTFYASASYCQPSTTLTWTCGGEQESPFYVDNSNWSPQPLARPTQASSPLRRGVTVMMYSSGMWDMIPALTPSLLATREPIPRKCQSFHLLLYSAVPSCLLFHSLPIITDLDFFLESLDSSLFPGIGSSIKVHSGFKESQAEYVWQFGSFRSLMNQNCLARLRQSFRR